MSYSKIFYACLLVLVMCMGPSRLYAQGEDFSKKDNDQFHIGATLKNVTTVETELDLQFSLSLSVLTSHIDLSKLTNNISKNGEIPGIVRVTGGSMEVMLDIEDALLEETVGDNTIKIYDFDVGGEGNGSSVVVLPAGDQISFTIAIGAKAEIFGSGNVNYFGNNVLSANYL